MKTIAFILLFALSNIAFAQTYYVSNIIEVTNDLSARRNAVKDNDGKDCALVRVNIPSVNNIKFSSSIVGSPEFLPGEYNVYLSEGSTSLTLTINDQIYDIDFSLFNISLEAKKCYRVVFSKDKTNNTVRSNVKITANYDNVVVMIDGVPVGQSPLVLDNISTGMHTFSVPNIYGVTMTDQMIDVKPNSTIKLNLHEEKRRPVLIEMAMPGGDTSGWSKVFGTNVKTVNGKKGIVDYAGNVIVPCKYEDVYPEIQNGYYEVYNNGKCGLYEPGNGLVVPCEYDGIITLYSYSHDNYMPVCKDNKWGLMSPNGEIIIPIKYYSLESGDSGVEIQTSSTYGSEGCGVLSYDGSTIVAPQYHILNPMKNGYSVFCKLLMDGREIEGIVDDKGNEKILPSNYRINNWGVCGTAVMDGRFPVEDKTTKKWGYMNTELKLVIPAIYNSVHNRVDAPNFNNGIVCLEEEGNKIIINSQGDVVLSLKDNGYKDFDIVCLSNYSFNKGLYFKWHETDDTNNTFISVTNNEEKFGLLDVKGNVVVPCRYKEGDIEWYAADDINYFVLYDDEQVTVMDAEQHVLFSMPSSLRVSDITDGFIMVHDKESGSYGYLNMQGEVLANCIYGYGFDTGLNDNEGEGVEDDNEDDELYSYDMKNIIEDNPISEGMALLNIGDRYGFIDNKGVVRVPMIYTAATPFENGVSYVRQQNGVWKKIYKKDL